VSTPAGPPPSTPLILVADDEAEVRAFVCDVLAEVGFATAAVADGDEVGDRAAKDQPRLIVLDLMMPRMDGYTALTRLQADPRTRDIPVIVLTGQSAAIYRTISAGVGAVAHLTKPFSARQLRDTVRGILGEPG
jgi:CheY-like chemotaxis protein